MSQEISSRKYSRTCVICGNDFRLIEGEICLSCAELKELEFIRHTLINNPSLNVSTLSKETGIPTSRILRYIQEGRLIT